MIGSRYDNMEISPDTAVLNRLYPGGDYMIWMHCRVLDGSGLDSTALCSSTVYNRGTLRRRDNVLEMHYMLNGSIALSWHVCITARSSWAFSATESHAVYLTKWCWFLLMMNLVYKNATARFSQRDFSIHCRLNCYSFAWTISLIYGYSNIFPVDFPCSSW